MLKLLLKKQLTEVFKGYFYNAKKNKKRSKVGVVLYFILFGAIMIGLLGGIFTALSLALCGSLAAAGMGWLYFVIMSGISILLGAFGSVFNTYSGLYMSKDNDLLLSMPIPVKDIIASRLLNVYLLGTMYSAVVILPALIVYWIKVSHSVTVILCGILLLFIITSFVLILSCLLGWVVAKISLKLKNKSFVTVILSLAFIGIYYFVYFKANSLIQNIIANAAVYGAKIKGAAYGVYLFGSIGEGHLPAALIFTGVILVLLVLTWYVLSRSFLSIATASSHTAKARYREKAVREKSAFGALLGKEFARFTSSANYMLNSGLGILLIPACGVLLLIKGQMALEVLNKVLEVRPGCTAVLLCAALCMLTSLNIMAAPSISLEGKNLWILQSLPVKPKTVLHAKAGLQLLLTGIPMLFTVLCVCIVFNGTPAVRILVGLVPLLFTIFMAMFALTLGLAMPNLTWTNETTPIKQGGAVTITMFGSWGAAAAFGALYFLIGYKIGPTIYLLLWALLISAVTAILLWWINTKGSRILARL